MPTLSDEKSLTDNWLEIPFSEKCQYLPLRLILAELRSAPYFWKSGILFKCLILVTYVQECGSSSPQLWSFLDHRRFCHLFRGSSQEPVWPSPFPILLLKCLRKENVAFFFLKWWQKGAKSELRLEQFNTQFSRLYVLGKWPRKNKDFFQAFFWGTLVPSPFCALWVHSDPLLSRGSILIPLFLESESQEQ